MSLNVGVASMYPVAEATSAAYLLDAAQIFGIVFILMMGAMVGNMRILTLWLGFGITAAFSALVLLFRGKMQRLQ
jgi:hypothetical protein